MSILQKNSKEWSFEDNQSSLKNEKTVTYTSFWMLAITYFGKK